MASRRFLPVLLMLILLFTACAAKPDGEVSYDDIAGSWYLENGRSHYSLSADGAFIFRTEKETFGGFYTWDGEKVVLKYEDLDKTVSLTLTEENRLFDSAAGETYIKNISGNEGEASG